MTKFQPWILFLIIAILITFGGLGETFFQQDEWMGLGNILVLGKAFIFHNAPNTISALLGQGRILASVITYFLLGSFPFNIFPLVVFGLFFHALNTVLVFFLARKFLEKSLPAFLAAAFFAVNNVSHGAVSWPAAIIVTLPAATFVFFSVFLFFKYLGTNKESFLLLTFLAAYISLFFKEIGVFLFFFLPLSVLILKKRTIKEVVLRFWPFLLFGLAATPFRILELRAIAGPRDLFVTGASENFLFTLLQRAVLYPLTSLSLTFIPPRAGYGFSKRLADRLYPDISGPLSDLYAQTFIMEAVAIFLTVFILLTLYFAFRKSSKETKRSIVFILGFLAFSFLPYVVAGKSFVYLESRFYYLGAAAAGILLGFVYLRVFELSRQASKAFLVFIFLYLVGNAALIHGEIAKQVEVGRERQEILTKISSVKEDIFEDTVFYFDGDRNFYITEGNPVPLQQGMGYTLLVWYLGNNKAPEGARQLIRDRFLWELGSQGYKKVNGFGFGFFWDRNELQKVIREKRLEPEEITALYYDSKTKRLSKNDQF